MQKHFFIELCLILLILKKNHYIKSPNAIHAYTVKIKIDKKFYTVTISTYVPICSRLSTGHGTI